MAIDWATFSTFLNGKQKLLITSHVRPDGDSIGSALGLAAVLRRLDRQPLVMMSDPIPPNLRFLDPAGEVATHDPSTPLPSELDGIVVVDTSSWQQLGSMADAIRSHRAPRAVIDHHASDDDFQAVMLKDSTCEATGRLIVDLAEAFGVSLDAAMAAPLFTAMATDTGWFRFPSVQPRTYEAAGQLVAAGARPQEVFSSLYERGSLARLRLRSLVLGRIEIALDQRLALLEVTQADLAACGAVASDTEDLVNAPLSVVGVEVSVLLSELADGAVKASLRSRNERLNCAELAARFGGGGHQAAAGATFHKSMAQARGDLVDALAAALS